MSSRCRVIASSPLFVVSDLQKSIDFYTTKLGFQKPNVWGEPPCFAMTERDGFELMLSLAQKPEQVRPNGPDGVWDVYLRVDDVAKEAIDLKAMGVSLASPLTKREYRMWELEVVDPDGYRICIAQDIS